MKFLLLLLVLSLGLTFAQFSTTDIDCSSYSDCHDCIEQSPCWWCAPSNSTNTTEAAFCSTLEVCQSYSEDYTANASCPINVDIGALVGIILGVFFGVCCLITIITAVIFCFFPAVFAIVAACLCCGPDHHHHHNSYHRIPEQQFQQPINSPQYQQQYPQQGFQQPINTPQYPQSPQYN